MLIEKPACGDFLPILDGGYGLQYSPLMEYREGRGLVLFCQLDVTGRTEADPVARSISQRLLEYVAAWRPTPRRPCVYAGDAVGRRHLADAGFLPADYAGGRLPPDQVLVLAPGAAGASLPDPATLRDFLGAGGRMLCLGLEQKHADALLPVPVVFTRAEHVSAFFDVASLAPALAGIGPADVHSRDPRVLPLLGGVPLSVGDGVLGASSSPHITYCQLLPWQFDPARQSNLKRTYRRASFLVARLLSNLGAAARTPLLERFGVPVEPAGSEKRWLRGLYLDEPVEWDDPYRFFRW